MKLLSKILTITTSALLAAGFLVAAPTAIPTSASAEAIISQLGIDIDGEAAGDQSGYSVSLSNDGTRVAIGAPQNDGAGAAKAGAGQVRVYEWDDVASSWFQAGADIFGESAGDRFGWSVSLSSDGSRIAIGAPGYDYFGETAGHVKVYEWNDVTSGWDKLGNDIVGEAAADFSGFSVSLSGDGSSVAIGAINNGGYAGHVRVYKLGGATWTRVGLDIDGKVAFERSGRSVSLSENGSIVAIGAPDSDVNGVYAGNVRVYKWNDVTSGWLQVGGDIDGEAAYDRFGWSVSLISDGSRIAIGAPRLPPADMTDFGGHVRVYEWNDVTSGWLQVGADINGEAANDHSGFSVSLSGGGTRVAIGTHNFYLGMTGHVRVYEWNDVTSGWLQVGADIDGEAVDNSYGFSVSLSSDGTRVAIGAPGYDSASKTDVGSVSLFSIPTPSPAPAPYTGPLLQDFSSRTLDVCTPKSITITGIRLLGATASVQGKPVTVLENTDTKLVLAVPAGLTPGNNVDLVINSSSGTLTHQDAFDIPADTCAAVLSKGRWTQLQSDGTTVKIYAKDPIGDGKIQFFVDGEEIAWVNAIDEADPKLSFASSYPYLVRSVELKPGKNRFEIKLDGVRVWRATYVPKG